MEESEELNRQKIIFTGDSGVGKTSIINSIMGQNFDPSFFEASIGVDFCSKIFKYKKKKFKLQIWDSAGQEKYKSLIPNYIRGSSLVFIVYDITSRKTFDSLQLWIDFVNNIENSNIVILGNKIDNEINRKVSKEEAETFCKEKNYKFFEVSAKSGKNIYCMLLESVSKIIFYSNISEDDTEEKIFNELKDKNKDNIKYYNITSSQSSDNDYYSNDNKDNNDYSLNGDIRDRNNRLGNIGNHNIIKNKLKKCC